MRARPAIAALTACACACVVLVSACATEEIVLARLPPANDAGSSVESNRCVDDRDCSTTSFCARVECGDVAGNCAARPVVCEEGPQPVCGCDGITYWNDCLRRATGITAMTPRECGPGAVTVVCGGRGEPGSGRGPRQCPPGSFCARLLPPLPPAPPGAPLCPPDVPGTCWGLPAVCPVMSGLDRWTACGGPDLECKTTCNAIRTGEPHRRANACL